MSAASPRGEEFRQDLRAPGARNAQARRLLSAQLLAQSLPGQPLPLPRKLSAALKRLAVRLKLTTAEQQLLALEQDVGGQVVGLAHFFPGDVENKRKSQQRITGFNDVDDAAIRARGWGVDGHLRAGGRLDRSRLHQPEGRHLITA